MGQLPSELLQPFATKYLPGDGDGMRVVATHSEKRKQGHLFSWNQSPFRVLAFRND
jgi:hypothetical protein